MNVKTIHMSDLFSQCDDIYLASMIVAKRAKQIINDRVIPIDENPNGLKCIYSGKEAKHEVIFAKAY